MSRSTLSHTRQSLLMSSSANPSTSTKYLSNPLSKKQVTHVGTQTEGQGREEEVRERLDEAEERCRREREERVRLEDVVAELMTKIKAMESKTDQRENTPHIVPQENHQY